MVQYWLSIFSGDNGFTTSFLLNWVMLFFFLKQVNLKKNITGTNMESGKDHEVGREMTPISEAVSWALPLLPLTAAYLSLPSPPLPLPSLSVTLQSTTQTVPPLHLGHPNMWSGNSFQVLIYISSQKG